MDDPVAAARAAGLRYVNDDDPGISRARAGKGFSYRDAEGRLVRDRATRQRIGGLAVPPAWRAVWICPSPLGHIQATGRDARGRKQYRYHPLWRISRDEAKYSRTIAFAAALPRLRRRVERDLRLTGLPRAKMLAVVVRLLESTMLRVGNEEYARDNRSFGLTTLRNRHAKVSSGGVRFSFRGKSGKPVEVGLRDRRVARVLRQCQDLPGQRLFQYVDDDGAVQPIESHDVNDYLRAAMGDDFSAKDFRTWAGTVRAVQALRDVAAELADSAGAAGPTQRRVVEAVKRVAHELGNTPAVCRRCYIHPQVFEAYLDGSLEPLLTGAGSADGDPSVAAAALIRDEKLVLQLLRGRAAAVVAAATRAAA